MEHLPDSETRPLLRKMKTEGWTYDQYEAAYWARLGEINEQIDDENAAPEYIQKWVDHFDENEED